MRAAATLNTADTSNMRRTMTNEPNLRIVSDVREPRAMEDGELLAALREADREAAVLHHRLEKVTAWSDALAAEKVRRAASSRKRR
jgi:cation diffusion facilitator CzcD-associated flavoprotein CzcO